MGSIVRSATGCGKGCRTLAWKLMAQVSEGKAEVAVENEVGCPSYPLGFFING